MTVHVDDVLKARSSGEPVRAPEGLGGKPSQMVDVGRDPFSEQLFENRVGAHLLIEQLLEMVDRAISAGMFVKRF